MQSTPTPKPPTLTTPVIVAIILLIVMAIAFFVVLLLSTQPPSGPGDATLEVVDYSEIVERLISIGDPTRAQSLIQIYSCAACHQIPGGQIAPTWDNLLAVAAERRPELTAEEYIYEAIVHPQVYLVEGYPASMPQDYGTRLSEQDLADIFVYLVNGGT